MAADFHDLPSLKVYAKKNAADILAGANVYCPKWMVSQFQSGDAPCDEPPGFMERGYQLWLAAGGVVKPPKPVTSDDL